MPSHNNKNKTVEDGHKKTLTKSIGIVIPPQLKIIIFGPTYLQQNRRHEQLKQGVGSYFWLVSQKLMAPFLIFNLFTKIRQDLNFGLNWTQGVKVKH